MANRDKKWNDNAQGAWYTDSDCIQCTLCHDFAPNNFVQSSQGDHDTVYKQPETEAELENCRLAQDNCPVSAIGNDG